MVEMITSAALVLTDIVGVVAILIGIFVLARCRGRLRISLFFAWFSTLLIVIKKSLVLTNSEISSIEFFKVWLDMGIVSSLLVSFIVFQALIKDLDRQPAEKATEKRAKAGIQFYS
ncbi:MAG TPA: hypothetical protein VJK03_00420 [Candidatus Nanoarchaeia archaeon]|nr:hypothetical protein [Candidatus Nanoarchaeia archaeon]